MSTFDEAFSELLGIEGGYTDDPRDPGNWTEGQVNAGDLKGTKWGVSAASYPHLDIANLTQASAKSLVYLPDFWDKMRCEAFPAQIGKALFKFGVNLGAETAVKLLQKAIGTESDGDVGNVTIGIAHSLPVREVLVNFCAECALHYTTLRNFGLEGRGWLRRTITTALESTPC